jgi:hypothetical protein
MKYNEQKIKVKDIWNGFKGNAEDDDVVGYNGKLIIRPSYQREFIYEQEQERKVIDTILKGKPLQLFYWCRNDNGKKTTYELMDGQQRTLSIMRFLDHKYSILDANGNTQYENTISKEDKDKILDYDLSVYICEGTDAEKLDWFNTINIAGLKLTEQELRNAVYTGPWLTDAKLHFSKRNCAGYKLTEKYFNAEPSRQLLLEAFLKGIVDKQGLKSIEEYMAKHRNDKDADELWRYCNDVINWINKTFTNYRKIMDGLDWCKFYNKYGQNTYNTQDIEKTIEKLMKDEDIEKKKGIYEYVLDNQNPFREKYLNLRAFLDKDQQTAYENQKGICPICGKHFSKDEMEADHIVPWSQGGATDISNLQMLCKSCNRQKSAGNAPKATTTKPKKKK